MGELLQKWKWSAMEGIRRRRRMGTTTGSSPAFVGLHLTSLVLEVKPWRSGLAIAVEKKNEADQTRQGSCLLAKTMRSSLLVTGTARRPN